MCDSPELLINATLQAAKKKIPDPAFILITGDYVRHHTAMLGLLGVDASTEVMVMVVTMVW